MEYIDFNKYFLQYLPFVQQLDNDELPVTKGIDFDNAYSNPAGQASPLYDYDYYKKVEARGFSDLFGRPVSETPTTSTTTEGTTSLNSLSVNTSDLSAAILKHLGETYSLARRRSKGYSDCSSFVSKVYGEMGVNLGFTPSPGLWKKYVDHIDLSLVKPGDLVFLTYTKKYGDHTMGGIHRIAGVTPTHVGIVVSVNGTELEIAENTGKGKSRINRYEIGDPNKHKKGVINYSKGNSGRNELLGFGRLKKLS